MKNSLAGSLIFYDAINVNIKNHLLCRFDLMYGVTELEKFHLPGPLALQYGMLNGQRNEILQDHAKVRSFVVVFVVGLI